MRRLLLVLALVLAALPAAARADVQAAAGGEPPYTKGTADTWFYDYSRPSAASSYRVLFSHGPAQDGAASPTEAMGEVSILRSGLVSGTTETECATEQSGDGAVSPVLAPPACDSTTIDNTRPTATVGLDGGVALTRDAHLAVHVTYADQISPPWPGGSTFLCASRGAPSGACRTGDGNRRVFQLDLGCSSRAPATDTAARTSAWDCAYDLAALPGGAPDGRWYLCAVEADFAIPDTPGSADQYHGHTSDEANLSLDTPSACGIVVLDRTPPVLTVAAHRRPAAGITFAATASDAGGLRPIAWSFGDGSRPVSGSVVRHVYARPGTYSAVARVADTAGNATRRTVRLRVSRRDLLPGRPCRDPRLRASAARHLPAGAARVPLALRTRCAGTARISLLRGRRVLARAARYYARAGAHRYRLAVPHLRPGVYRLSVSFLPARGRPARPASVHLSVAARARRAGAARAILARRPRTGRGAAVTLRP